MEQEWEGAHVAKHFECASKRELAMKCRIHHRFCSNLPVAFDKIRVSKKACTMREQLLIEYER